MVENLLTEKRGLSLSRVLEAPIELVWEVWTNPEHIKNWWGPDGFTNTISKMEVQKDGEWEFVMHGSDGVDYDNKHIFRELIKYEKIVLEHIGYPSFLATIEFVPQGEKTLLKWSTVFKSEEELAEVIKKVNAAEGLKQNVEKLAKYVSKASIAELTMTRTLNAKRELVFKAFTDESMMKEWWGPHGFTNPVCKMDVKPNGKWKICMDAPQFPDHWCSGIFLEIVSPERLVFTSNLFMDQNDKLVEDEKDCVKIGIKAINTITLEDLNEKTKLTLNVRVLRLADELRESVNGMEEGWSQSFERLNTLVEK